MEKRLQRDEHSKMIGGVAAGLAEYFDVEVTWVRLAFILAVLAGFSGVLAYIILWIAVPAKPFYPFQGPGSSTAPDYRVYNDQSFNGPVPPPQPNFGAFEQKVKKDDNGRLVAGFILIAVGGCFLVNQLDLLPYWFSFWKLWPLALIIPGILLAGGSGLFKRNQPPVVEPPVDPATEKKAANFDAEPDTDTTTTTTDPSQNT